MDLYNVISPQTLVILGGALAVIFVIVALVVFRDMILLDKSPQDVKHRVEELRLGDMISYLRIPLSLYDQQTSDLDKLRHIQACERCRARDKCERLFAGEDLHPENFCPNFFELVSVRGWTENACSHRRET